MTNRTWYIAGKMTGVPQFNFPMFDLAAAELRNRGYQVVSPSELDTSAARQAALASKDGAAGVQEALIGDTWGDLLARDIKIVADSADGVVVLPGWRNSKGARLETFVAFLCGKPIVYYPSLRRVPQGRLFAAWLGSE